MASPLTSFIEVTLESHFPIQNLPFGIFQAGATVLPRVGVAIGDFVLDLVDSRRVTAIFNIARISKASMAASLSRRSLNAFLSLGRPAWRKAREVIQKLLAADDADAARRCRICASTSFTSRRTSSWSLPARIGNYTDFYSSREHATNVGIKRRGPDNALMPNWPCTSPSRIMAGPAASLDSSGTDVRRPLNGQTKKPTILPPRRSAPVARPRLRLELGLLIGQGNSLGSPITNGERGGPCLRHGARQRLERT